MRLVSLLFLLCLLASSLSGQSPATIYSVDQVEELPHFVYDVSTCKDKEAKCADRALSIYLERNMEYPTAAHQSQLEGKATVEVVVETTGELTKIQLIENPGKGTGKEALRLVNSMNDPDYRWVPGKLKGKAVRTRIVIPVGFYISFIEMAAAPPPPPPRPRPSPPSTSEVVFRVVEVMPTFPYDPEDCPEGIRISCGRKALQTYLQENTYYPTEALNAGIEGIAVITFIVEPDGVITNAKIIRDPGEGTGEEALRVVTQMSEMERRWFPGTQRGRAVRVQYNLPVKFKIGFTKEAPGASRDSIYIVVDTAPLFPRSQSGCEKTPIECSTGTMLNYVYNQVNYPEEALAQGVYGMSVVKFVVEKDGTMSDLTLARDPGAGTGDEALRVVKTIVDNNLLWTPGEIEGEPVRTRFALPIKFSLTKRQVKEAKKRAKQARKN